MIKLPYPDIINKIKEAKGLTEQEIESTANAQTPRPTTDSVSNNEASQIRSNINNPNSNLPGPSQTPQQVQGPIGGTAPSNANVGSGDSAEMLRLESKVRQQSEALREISNLANSVR